MEEALLQYLRAFAPLTALISSRTYWVQLPQGYTNPYLLLTRVSGVRDTTFDGAGGFSQSRIQCDAYAQAYLTAKEIARAVELRLSGKSFTHQGIYFAGCFLDSERDTFENEATPVKLFRTSIDFLIWHRGV